ncbi:MAG: TRAP transporter substrate-binding protein [Proteobacteria bacterium]|nr:TRAP transporter substrate-binding protein [Pseudomonadota bacterium]
MLKKKNKQGHPVGRRTILKAAGLSAAALLAGCGQGSEPASGDGTVPKKQRNLKMVTTWPKNFPGIGTGAERFARRVGELSERAINIHVYAAGELAPALSAFDAVSGGKADMYHGAEYYWQGRSRAFNFFAAVPFGMTATEINAWIHHDGGQQLWDELSAGFNIKPMMCGNSGCQAGGWFRKEINTLEDLQGLRIRIPGLGGEVFRRLGATPVTKPGGEIFLALSQGNIDAAEWIGPWNDMAFGFHTIADYYYFPGIHEPGTVLSLGLNLDLWNELSAWEQTVIRTAAESENSYMWAEFNAMNARALDLLVNQHGVKLRRFSDDILREMLKISRQVLKETAAEDDLTGRVYNSFKASLERQSFYGEVSERAFRRARMLGEK